MAIEQGIVVKLGSHGSTTAWVKTVRSSACESCASRDSCNPTGNGTSQEVEAINAAGAAVGDRIQLIISTGSMLKAMFLLYLFPILCMLGGGIAGDWMAPKLSANPSTVTAITAFTCFALSLVIVRAGGQRLGRKEAYQPKIIRILSHGPKILNADDPANSCKSLNGNIQ